MALNKKMEAYIAAEVSAGRMTADYAGRLGATLGEGPDTFQTSWLRQSDYDRAMADANTTKAKWETWGVDAQAELNKYAARITELEAAPPAPGLPPGPENEVSKEIAALKAQIATIGTGFITKAEFDRQLEAAKHDVRVSTIGIMGDFDAERRAMEQAHHTAFGRPMTVEESNAVIEFANTKQKELGRPVKITEAHDMKYAAESRAKWEADTTARITKDLETRFRTPVQGGAPVGARGPLEIRMKELEGKELPLGSDSMQEAKARAAAALRAGGSF